MGGIQGISYKHRKFRSFVVTHYGCNNCLSNDNNSFFLFFGNFQC